MQCSFYCNSYSTPIPIFDVFLLFDFSGIFMLFGGLIVPFIVLLLKSVVHEPALEPPGSWLNM